MLHWSIVAALLSNATSVPASVEKPVVVAFGDSLSAGFGLDPGLGFAPQLQATLRRHGIAASVVNAGVSGETSTAGAARIGWMLDGLKEKPDLVIVELGANDMLRGIEPAETRSQLDVIVSLLQERGIPVLLAGMLASRNTDPAKRERFDAIYPQLAKKYGVPLYPFFMEGLIGVPGMIQPDGLHPTAKGVREIVSRIIEPVKSALRTSQSSLQAK